MVNKKDRFVPWVLGLAMLLAVMMPMVPFTVQGQGSRGLDEEEALILQRQLEVGTDIAAVEAELTSQQAEYNRLQEELDQLYADDKAEKREYELLTQRMDEARQALLDSKAASEEAKENVEAKQEQYETRLIAMFENRNTSSLEVLLQSDSVSGFFTNLELIQVIADSDKEMLMELRGAVQHAQVSLAMAQVTATRSQEVLKSSEEKLEGLANGIRLREEDFNTLNISLMNRQGDLDLLLAENANLSGALQNVRDQQAIEAAAAQAAAVAAEESRQAELEAAQAAPQAPPVQAPINNSPTPAATGGVPAATTPAPYVTEPTTQSAWDDTPTEPVWTEAPTTQPVWSEAPTTQPVWTEAPTTPAPTTAAPVQASPSMKLYFPNGYSSVVTSYYGPRWGSFHTGIDFQGAFGTSVMAAAGGTVIVASAPVQGQEWGGSGYANHVIIDHGNGISTLYAHLMSVHVSSGQYVSAGQQIGLCGATGWATGPHLHFEVRVNGVHVDPLPYLW